MDTWVISILNMKKNCIRMNDIKKNMKNRTKRVLITNTCLLNNGDALLISALGSKLKKEGYSVFVSSKKNEKLCRKRYPKLKWVNNPQLFSGKLESIFSLIPEMKKHITCLRIVLQRIFFKFDVIISAPGGYINKYYGFEEVLFLLRQYKRFHQAKLIMYSQSVGPLTEIQHKILHEYLTDYDLFMVRDKYSYEWVDNFSNVLQTNDAAFLCNIKQLDRIKSGRIGVSVREWNYDGRKLTKYIELMRTIVLKCVEMGYNVDMISTCQGSAEYIDDSKMAEKIVRALPKEYRKKIYVDNTNYTLPELRRKVLDYDAICATRLHMCIMSVISSIPAFNISYENKGVECYRQLGLELFSIDYNEPVEYALEKFDLFLKELQCKRNLENLYYQKAKEMNEKATNYFKIVKERVLEKD